MTTEPQRFSHIPTERASDDDRWMARIQQLEDHEVDALLSGEAPSEPSLAPISDVARALRTRAAWEPVPALGQRLREQLSGGLPTEGRRATRRALLVAAAAVIVAGLAAVSVGAAQNRLPTELQDAVASTAGIVGLDVPTSDERPGGSGEARSEIGADHARDDDAPFGAAASADADPGAEGTTPGGAMPADRGAVGDDEPADPAVPPDEPGTVAAGGPADAAPEDPGAGARAEPDDGAGTLGEDDDVPSNAPEQARPTTPPVARTGR